MVQVLLSAEAILPISQMRLLMLEALRRSQTITQLTFWSQAVGAQTPEDATPLSPCTYGRFTLDAYRGELLFKPQSWGAQAVGLPSTAKIPHIASIFTEITGSEPTSGHRSNIMPGLIFYKLKTHACSPPPACCSC